MKPGKASRMQFVMVMGEESAYMAEDESQAIEKALDLPAGRQGT